MGLFRKKNELPKNFPRCTSELYKLDEVVDIKNPYMLFLVEILKELHEIKELLAKNNNSSNGSN